MFSSVVNWCHCYLFNRQMFGWKLAGFDRFFTVQHHFYSGSHSQTPLPCWWKRQICCDDRARLCISSCAQYVRLVCLHTWWSVSVTSLLDSNTQSLINPVFILVNLWRTSHLSPPVRKKVVVTFYRGEREREGEEHQQTSCAKLTGLF